MFQPEESISHRPLTKISRQEELAQARNLEGANMRRALMAIRQAWSNHSPECPCYPSQTLENGLSIETIALAKVCEKHHKRHLKSKQANH